MEISSFRRYECHIAKETVDLLLYEQPTFMQNIGKKVIATVIDDRLRRVMVWKDSPWYYTTAIKTIVEIRRFYLLRFALPRYLINRPVLHTVKMSEFKRVEAISQEIGRAHV